MKISGAVSKLPKQLSIRACCSSTFQHTLIVRFGGRCWVREDTGMIAQLNNSLHLYIAFWVLKALYIEEGNLLNHHQCAASTWMMRRQPYCARMPTTHQLTGGEKTEWWSQSVDMGMIRRPWWSEANGEIWPILPLLFFEGCPGIFNDQRVRTSV